MIHTCYQLQARQQPFGQTQLFFLVRDCLKKDRLVLKCFWKEINDYLGMTAVTSDGGIAETSWMKESMLRHFSWIWSNPVAFSGRKKNTLTLGTLVGSSKMEQSHLELLFNSLVPIINGPFRIRMPWKAQRSLSSIETTRQLSSKLKMTTTIRGKQVG